MEQAFYDLDAPVARVCSAEVPVPYPRHLEEAALPSPARIDVRRTRADRLMPHRLPHALARGRHGERHARRSG